MAPDETLVDPDKTPDFERTCDNCTATISAADDRFCSKCGQNDKDYRQGFWRVILDIFREQVDFQSRASKSIRELFAKPGQLAVEFRNNRRAAYIPPIRMYLFSGLLFFFLTSSSLQQQAQETALDESSEEFDFFIFEFEGVAENGGDLPDEDLGSRADHETWLSRIREVAGDQAHQYAQEVLGRPDSAQSKFFLTAVLEFLGCQNRIPVLLRKFLNQR